MSGKQWLQFVALFGLLLLLSAGVVHSVSALGTGWGNMPLDSARWKAEKGRFDADMDRTKMVRSLVRAHRVRGMTRLEVLAALGEPERCYDERGNERGDARSAPVFAYWLGFPGSDWDCYSLFLTFTAAGTVRDWYIAEYFWPGRGLD